MVRLKKSLIIKCGISSKTARKDECRVRNGPPWLGYPPHWPSVLDYVLVKLKSGGSSKLLVNWQDRTQLTSQTYFFFVKIIPKYDHTSLRDISYFLIPKILLQSTSLFVISLLSWIHYKLASFCFSFWFTCRFWRPTSLTWWPHWGCQLFRLSSSSHIPSIPIRGL